MSGEEFSALVVDDESTISKLLAPELAKRGISCDVAGNGVDASRLIETKPYQAIVTDLRTANGHGRPLITELLQRKLRPLVVVYAGPAEPRLADELKARGVDEVFLKPFDCGLMAARIKTLIDRRARKSPAANEVLVDRKTIVRTHSAAEELLDGPAAVTMSQLTAKMPEISRVMPISNAALDVYNMTRSDGWDMSELAAAAQRDAALTTEILRRANSAHYNSSGRQISDLQEAVMRIGQRRVGELALTTSAMSMLTPSLLPWIDRDLDWKRSMAAGLVMESLIDQGRHVAIEDGLILSAVMQSMGQVLLGMLFPKHYEVMLKRCEKTGEALQELERSYFPATNTEVMAQVLAGWRIPEEVHLPLKFSLHNWAQLAELPEPARTKTELVKLAIILGRLSIERWKTWDLVELPPSRVLERLRINDVRNIVRTTRSDVNTLAQFGRPDRLNKQPAKQSESCIELEYVSLQEEANDALAELLPALGVEPRPCTMIEVRTTHEPFIVNCLEESDGITIDADAAPLAIRVVDQVQLHMLGHSNESIAFPQSFGSLREAFHHRLSEVVARPAVGAAAGAK